MGGEISPKMEFVMEFNLLPQLLQLGIRQARESTVALREEKGLQLLLTTPVKQCKVLHLRRM